MYIMSGMIQGFIPLDVYSVDSNIFTPVKAQNSFSSSCMRYLLMIEEPDVIQTHILKNERFLKMITVRSTISMQCFTLSFQPDNHACKQHQKI